MSIRCKTIVIICLTLTGLTAFIYGTAGTLVHDSIKILIASVLVSGGVTLLLLERLVLSRLARLSADVSSISQSGDLSARVSVTGKDEIENLAVEVNTMIAALEKSHSELRLQASIINSARDYIIITDPEGIIRYVNPAFLEGFGYTSEEILGQYVTVLRSGKHSKEYVAELWNTINAGKVWKGELIDKKKDGSLCTQDVVITPVTNDAGDIEYVVAIKRDITEKRKYEEQLDRLAHHDLLTGLPNRFLFGDKLTQTLVKARTNGNSVAVMLLDLDRFKIVNDTLGHKMGDTLLKQVAQRLSACLRDVDIIARMGGDEFSIMLGDLPSPDYATRVAQRMLSAVATPFALDGREVFVAASIGISCYPADGDDAETLVANADTAMYRAKEIGRNCCQMYTSDLNTTVLERVAMESSLRRAVEREELALYYQPRVELKTGALTGAEALIRWLHPEMGVINPGQFIPMAEETGIIIPISEWILYTACAQNKRWQEDGYPPMTIAVNVSACQLQHGNLVATVQRVLEVTGLEPKYLDLELTESAVMRSPEKAISVLEQLRAMDVNISIDDFGTGYSSLAYLKKFPVNTVKIDMSFIRDITTNPDDAAIAGAVVAMAHSLNLKVVAEGVETLGQLEFLRSLTCDEVQGYFISHPVPAEGLKRLISRNQHWDVVQNCAA